MTMTSRERLCAAARREPIDRPATGLRCTPEAWEKLRGHLGVKTNQEVLDTLDVDLRWLPLTFIGPEERSAIPLGSEGVDFWGVESRKISNEFNTYYEFSRHPLAEADTLADVEAHDWPDLDWWNYQGVPEAIEEINQAQPRSIMFFAGGTFETPWYIRGMERFLTDLYDRPDMVDAICSRVGDYYLNRAKRVLQAGEGLIDLVGTGGDIGTQRGMMVSPDIWRERIMPHSGGLIRTFRDMGLRTFYHSCGSLVPVIDDLIQCGLDILDPIQVTAAGMEPEALFHQFGDRLSFHGAIDEVELLPHASASQVYDETRRIIKALGGNNGLIVAPSHQVQGDTPPENVVAIFDAVRSMEQSP